jgi:serine/threonine-protein kinase
MGSIIELRALGTVEMTGAPRPELDAVLAQPKRLALLTYLALNREHGFVRRDTLVGLFWPELDDSHARNALSQALRFLRRHLGDGVIIRRGEEEVALAPNAVHCDVERFEDACSGDDHVTAIELYRGELLAGLFVNDAQSFDLWLEERRAHLARQYGRSLEAAADQYARVGDTGKVDECWRRRAAIDPHNVAIAMKLMLARASAGDRAGAIEHAGCYARRLATDLDATPEPAILELAERLRAAPTSRVVKEGATGRGLTVPDLGDGPRRAQSAPPSNVPNADRSAGSREAGRRAGALLPVAALSLVALLALFAVKPTAGARPKRVIVSVFANETGDSSLARLGTMAADWIAQGLQQTGFVDVLPAGMTLPMPHDGATAAPGSGLRALRSLGRTTNADYVVSGAIYLNGDTLRFQPQIMEMSSLRLVGAPSAVVVGRTDDVRGINVLRQRVMGSLASVLDPRVANWAASASNPPSLAAFSEFQAGLDQLVAHHNSAAAVTHFERAAAMDSSYIVPRLWMIQALMRMGTFSQPRLDSAFASVERSSDRLARADALLLDRLEAMRRDDRAGATRASLELAALAPSSYFVQMLAEDAAFANRPGEAVSILSRLDPNWPWVREWQEYWSLLAYTLHVAGDYERELVVARQARATNPDSRRFLWLECQALAGLGRVDELRQVLGGIDTVSERDPNGGEPRPDGILRNIGLELRAHGYPEPGRVMLERADAWYEARAAVEPPTVGQVHQHMLILSELGRWREADAAARVVLDSFPNDVMPAAIRGVAAVSLGDSAAAQAQLVLLTSAGDERDASLRRYEAAKVAAALGERERAIGLLGAAFAGGRRHTFWDHLAVEFEPLRRLPAYDDLMRPTR